MVCFYYNLIWYIVDFKKMRKYLIMFKMCNEMYDIKFCCNGNFYIELIGVLVLIIRKESI